MASLERTRAMSLAEDLADRLAEAETVVEELLAALREAEVVLVPEDGYGWEGAGKVWYVRALVGEEFVRGRGGPLGLKGLLWQAQRNALLIARQLRYR